jgi:hypothetical protein
MTYFPRTELEAAGFSPPLIKALEQVTQVAAAIDRIGGTEAAIAGVTDDLTDTNNTVDTLDTRLDVVEAFTNTDLRYVRQDQGPAFAAATGTASRSAYASYAAPAVSAAYVQAELQAVANAVQALSQAVVALITDGKANGVLT